jgi:hypothetical protein
MTPRRQRKPVLEPLIDELSDESEDERRDFGKRDRNLFESKHGPAMGSDGDDNRRYAQPKQKIVTDKLGTDKKGKRKDITKPEDIIYPLQVTPRADNNLRGQMVEAGHGFLIDDKRVPWKTAPRTNCAHCGGPMPTPKVSGEEYRCEFDPEACLRTGCQCSGCTLRSLVVEGQERGRGNPPKCCSDSCKQLRDNERGRWRTACASADKGGNAPPPEPEDRA